MTALSCGMPGTNMTHNGFLTVKGISRNEDTAMQNNIPFSDTECV